MDYKKEEIKQHIIDNIDYLEGTESQDLHHNLFNTDYYLIGYYACERWLNDEGLNNTFEAINYIKEYEENNFGESYTDFTSSESVVNMYVYIIGEEIFSEFDLYDFEGELTKKDIENIKFRFENEKLFKDIRKINNNKMKALNSGVNQINNDMMNKIKCLTWKMHNKRQLLLNKA
jgi:hypothetical protein